MYGEIKMDVYEDTDCDEGVQGIKRPMSFILLVIRKDGFLKLKTYTYITITSSLEINILST